MTQTPDDKPSETEPKVGYIPKPPSQADIDQVSQDQALITDEWADGDEPGAGAGSAPPGDAAR